MHGGIIYRQLRQVSSLHYISNHWPTYRMAVERVNLVLMELCSYLKSAYYWFPRPQCGTNQHIILPTEVQCRSELNQSSKCLHTKRASL